MRERRLVAATAGLNASALFGERNNLCGQYGDLNDFARALETLEGGAALAGRSASGQEQRADRARCHVAASESGSRLDRTDRWEEAARVFEANVGMFEATAAQSSSLQVEYLLAASEGAMGGIEEHRAAKSRASPRHWKRAADWYERAVPRFDFVASKLALTEADMVLIRGAKGGLARSRSKLSESGSRDQSIIFRSV